MNQTDFSVVLPSNSSMKIFPDNTTTSFSVRLPRAIELHDKWQVGLSEIQVPCTTLHLRHDDTEIYYTYENENVNEESGREKFHFQHGVYKSIKNLIDSINTSLRIYHNNQQVTVLFYEEQGGFVTMRIHSKSIKCIFTPIVKRILGFEHGFEVPESKNSEFIEFVGLQPATLAHGTPDQLYLPESENSEFIEFVGRQPATLAHAIPDQLYVYTNICVPCIVGDTHAPLLRIVNLDVNNYNYGSTIVKKYSPINYIPIISNHFQIIDIDVRDQFGQPVAFEFGTLTVTLHFRREF